MNRFTRKKRFLIRVVAIFGLVYLFLVDQLVRHRLRYEELTLTQVEEMKTVVIYRSHCSLETCFNRDRCLNNGFKVFVYSSPKRIVSEMYAKIVAVLNSSVYATQDPDKACIFLPAVDTLSRDIRDPNYIPNLGKVMGELKYWNEGENHVIFNMFSGTWPHYAELPSINASKAIMIKASFSRAFYRPNFDVSLPLLGQNHPFNVSLPPPSGFESKFPKKYLLTFKGKRYLTGIGSETRNSLYKLHNDRDVIMLTTCRHLNYMHLYKDKRCSADNALYDRFDYDELLENSRFCLVPRGRRLGSFRFLEVLRVGCVPVILSNGWVLPYSELVDWSRVVVWSDERDFNEIVPRLRAIPLQQVVRMSLEGRRIYERHFATIERVVLSTLEILKKRIFVTQSNWTIF